MAVKKTIAIVGATSKAGSALAKKLAFEPFRILIISQDQHRLSELEDAIKTTSPQAEVEKIDCIKEACWEADIIILAVDPVTQRDASEKIKQVATQKIVMHFIDEDISDILQIQSAEELKAALPYSKIFTVNKNTVIPAGAELAADDRLSTERIFNLTAIDA